MDHQEEKENNTEKNISTEKKKGGTWKKFVWMLIAFFSFGWIFLPEVTDLVPVIGWLDEGIAVILFFKSLSELGIQIPVIEKIVNFFYGKKKKSGKIS